jgi:hypothetical protein
VSTTQARQASEQTVETNIPARLDRLPWSRWHWMIVFGLGTVWILDGLTPADSSTSSIAR